MSMQCRELFQELNVEIVPPYMIASKVRPAKVSQNHSFQRCHISFTLVLLLRWWGVVSTIYRHFKMCLIINTVLLCVVLSCAPIACQLYHVWAQPMLTNKLCLLYLCMVIVYVLKKMHAFMLMWRTRITTDTVNMFAMCLHEHQLETGCLIGCFLWALLTMVDFKWIKPTNWWCTHSWSIKEKKTMTLFYDIMAFTAYKRHKCTICLHGRLWRQKKKHFTQHHSCLTLTTTAWHAGPPSSGLHRPSVDTWAPLLLRPTPTRRHPSPRQPHCLTEIGRASCRERV